MAEAAAVLGVVGGGVSAIGELNAGTEAEAEANHNAALADRDATITRQQTAENERRARVLGDKQLGSMRDAYGASGASTTESSALNYLRESASNAELDALSIRYQGELKAQSYTNEGAELRRRGANAKAASKLAAAGSLLGGAAKGLGNVNFSRTQASPTPYSGGGDQNPYSYSGGTQYGSNTRGRAN